MEKNSLKKKVIDDSMKVILSLVDEIINIRNNNVRMIKKLKN